MTLRDHDNLQSTLENLQDSNWLIRPTVRGALQLQGYLQVYPPKPPRSRYKRTGKLGQGFYIDSPQVSSELVSVTLNNRMNYAPYVLSEEWQASWMTHWTTEQQQMETHADTIVEFYAEEIERIL